MKKFSKILRKLHLWLSIPFGVFITLICFSGAMLVYEQEITECLRHDLYYVDAPGAQPLPIDSLMRRVQASLPDTVTATGITASPDPERTWQVSLSAPRRASVFVDPYTGEVKGRNDRLPFFDTMFHLHRWLLGPSQSDNGRMPAGKWIVGTSTLVLVLILLTGIGMWLTNRRKPLRKSLCISLTKGWPRFWHDLHVAGGIYVTIFLLAVALTGLTWSFSWYRTGFYALCGVEASADGGHGGGHGAGRHGNRPQHGAHQGHNGGRHGHRGHHRAAADSLQHDTATARPHRHAEEAATAAARPERQQPQADIQDELPGQPADTARTDTHEHRHHGGRGHHRHEGDSTGTYRRHHRPDSLRETAGEAYAPADTARTAQESAGNDRHHGRTGTHKGPGSARGQETHRRGAERPHAAAAKGGRDSMATAPAAGPACEDSTHEAAPYTHWQTFYEQLVRTNPGYRQITLADGTAGVVPEGRRSLRAADTYDFDPLTGQVTATHPYADTDKATRVRSAIYMVHVGSWLGWISRLVNFLAALIGATLPLTGYYLWLRHRRNRQKHGHDPQSGHKPAQ